MARGSVFKRSGGWAYKVDTGFHPETGKRRQKVKQGFRTKREAELALAEVQKTVIDGTVVSGTNLRLGDFLDEWLAGQESPTARDIEEVRILRRAGSFRLPGRPSAGPPVAREDSEQGCYKPVLIKSWLHRRGTE